jgi:hypothetical protein
VFIHAVLKPERRLHPSEHQIKENARKILDRVQSGESVVTSTSHITEIANILEARMRRRDAMRVLRSIVSLEYLTIMAVERQHVVTASIVGSEIGLGYNYTIAYILMLENGITEIYSFDKDFNNVEEITRKNS